MPVIADVRPGDTRYYVDNKELAFSAAANPVPTAEGSLVISDATLKYIELLHSGAAGYALITDATTADWDQTPLWTGSHTWDDGVGDSPSLILIGGSDDQASIFLDDDGTPGDSDLVIRLPGTDDDAQFQIQSSAPATVAYIDAAGNADFSGHIAVGGATTVSSVRLVNVSETFTNLAATTVGLFFEVDLASGIGYNTSHYGLRGQVNVATAQVQAAGVIAAVQGSVLVDNGIAATLNDVRGVFSNIDIEDADCAIASAIHLNTPLVDTGAITAGYGIRLRQGAVGAGSITTLYGLNIANINAGGTNWAIYTAAGDVRFGDAVHIVDFLYHDGDPNTFLSFTPDAIDVQAGGVQFLTITEAGQDTLVINEGGVDIDFRVEALGVADALQVLGSSGQITLGALGTGLVKSTAGVLSIGAVAADLPVHTHANAAQGGATISATLYNAVASVSAVFTHSANIVLDDGVGDSPSVSFVGGSNNDTISIFLDDDAVSGDSDLVIRLVDTSGDSGLIIQDGIPANILSIFSDGNVVIRDNHIVPLRITDAGTTEYMRFVTLNAQPEIVISEGGADIDVRFEAAGPLTHAFYFRGSDGHIGVNTQEPDGRVHIHSSTAGAVTASTLANDLVVEGSKVIGEDGIGGGVSFLGGNFDSSYILFGSPADDNQGSIRYDRAGDYMSFGAGGFGRVWLFGTGNVNIGNPSDLAQLAVLQSSSTGAEPVLRLDQYDIDMVLMKILAFADVASVDRTLVADSDFGTPGALVGWIQIAIQDQGNRVSDGDYYIPFYAAPS